jgi:hypothetical protein
MADGSPNIAATLTERGRRYGTFQQLGEISQPLKFIMREHPGWYRLQADQKEALEMIASKIARILNGDPNLADSWHDIAGYASLVDKRLSGEVV